VPRISLDAGFQTLLRTGLAATDALDLITHEATRKGGGLNVWCNGNLLRSRYIAKHLDFELDAEGRAKVYPVGIGWQQAIKSYVFELDADQVEALIAKPKKPGRPPKEVDAAAIKAAKEKRRAEKKPATQAKLAEQFGVSKSTIRRREQKK
jgi:hypothetical protein